MPCVFEELTPGSGTDVLLGTWSGFSAGHDVDIDTIDSVILWIQ